MYVCVCAWVYQCVHGICVNRCVGTCGHMCVCGWIYHVYCVYMCIVHVCMCVHMHVMCVDMYKCNNLCKCTWMCVYY